MVTVRRPRSVSLATGSRVCVLPGLLLLVVAAYVYGMPISALPLRALTAVGGAVVLVVVGPPLFAVRPSDDHASAAG